MNWKKLFYKKLAQRNHFGSSGLEENILHEGGLKKMSTPVGGGGGHPHGGGHRTLDILSATL